MHWAITLVTVFPGKYREEADGTNRHVAQLSPPWASHSYAHSRLSCQVDFAFETLGNQELRSSLSLLGSNPILPVREEDEDPAYRAT